MHRFIASAENIKDKITISNKKEIHHIQDVLRLKRNKEVIIFDGRGNEYISRIDSLSSQRVELTVISREENSSRKDWSVCLACALPKKSKFDFIVEKATELGADRIIPLKTTRTIVDLKKEREEKKLQHWREIAVNSSKQSQRNSIPVVEKVATFNQAVQEVKKYDLGLIPCLPARRACLFAERQKIEEVLMRFKGKGIIVFIGPEGDFSPDEVSWAVKSGCQPVTLGGRVLKVDSAAFYTLAVINFISQIK